MRIPHADRCDRHRRAQWPRALRDHHAGHDPHSRGGKRGRGLVLARRPHHRGRHPHCPHRAPLHDDGALRCAARFAHVSRSGFARVRPRGSRRPAGGRVRRESRALRPRTYPARFGSRQDGAELGPLRDPSSQRVHPHSRAQRRGDPKIDDRSRGLHPRRGLPAGRVGGGARFLYRRGHAGDRRRRRRGQGDGGVDHRGTALPRPVAGRHPALRTALRGPRLCRGPGRGGLRSELHGASASGRVRIGPPPAHQPGVPAPGGPGSRLRGEGGMGAAQLVQGQRGRRFSRPGPLGLDPAQLVVGHPRRTRGHSHRCRDL